MHLLNKTMWYLESVKQILQLSALTNDCCAHLAFKMDHVDLKNESMSTNTDKNKDTFTERQNCVRSQELMGNLRKIPIPITCVGHLSTLARKGLVSDLI